MDTRTEDLINAAADWWVKAIERPKFDNGDPSPTGGMATVLAMLANRPKGNAELEKFRESFVTRLKADFEADRAPRLIGVDYGPCGWLCEVADQAGCATRITDWPWKTNMHISDGKVEVSAGYGAEYKTIFPTPEKTIEIGEDGRRISGG